MNQFFVKENGIPCGLTTGSTTGITGALRWILRSSRRKYSFFYRRECGFAFIAKLLIKAYQYSFSLHNGPCCRYYPSCSHYALEAIETYGVMRGGWISFKRILKCHPWGGSGYDPVPKLKSREYV